MAVGLAVGIIITYRYRNMYHIFGNTARQSIHLEISHIISVSIVILFFIIRHFMSIHLFLNGWFGEREFVYENKQ